MITQGIRMPKHNNRNHILFYFLLLICLSVKSESIDTVALSFYFSSGKYELLPSEFEPQEVILDELSERKCLEIIINGYADDIGNKELNALLSQKRAEFVRNLIANIGYDDSLFTVVEGCGELALCEKGNIKSLRLNNRRVDVEILFDNTKKRKVEHLIYAHSDSIKELSVLSSMSYLPTCTSLTLEHKEQLRPIVDLLRKDTKERLFILGHCWKRIYLNGISIEHLENYKSDQIQIIRVITQSELELVDNMDSWALTRSRNVYYYLLDEGIDAKKIVYAVEGSYGVRIAPLEKKYCITFLVE